jgi:hypothetical protein
MLRTILPIAGCALLGISISACTPSTSAALITEIQQDAMTACSFLPTAETVTQLITVGNIQATAGLTLGSTIASDICKAVSSTPAPSSLKKATIPSINGIPINGIFVKQ